MRHRRKKEKQQREIIKIVEPYDDIEPENVSYLIQNSEGRYIVFLDADGELDWETTDDCNISGDELFNEVNSEIYILQQDPCVYQMDTKTRLQYNRLLGGILVAALEKNEKSARKLLRKAKEYLHSREHEITRKWFVVFCLICFAVLAVIFLIARTKGDILSEKSTHCLFFGAMGGTWSILQQSGKQKHTCSAGRFLVFMEVVSRLVISMLAAFFIWNAFRAKFIFTNFLEGNGRGAFENCLCMVAGFSERIAPSLIEKFESTKEDEYEKESIDSVESGI